MPFLASASALAMGSAISSTSSALLCRSRTSLILRSSYRIRLPVHHLPRDTRILNLRVPISEAPPLFFFLLRTGDSPLRLVKKFLQTICHDSPRETIDAPYHSRP